MSRTCDKDRDFLDERRSGDTNRRSDLDTRGASERDYARIIHSSAFRRLQNKMQAFVTGEGDFYRTRLTHSMEVAQIGAGVTEHLRALRSPETEEYSPWLPDMRRIEAICLAHDIGNPPFGHSVESVLNEFAFEVGGFEGNGQTFRILSKLEQHTEKFGMDLTRRTLLGTIKYPVSYSEAAVPSKEESFEPPKCYLDCDRDVFDWVMEPFSRHDRERFSETLPPKKQHRRARHKSLDASLMEIADDIAYCVHDLEDALKYRLLLREDCDGIKAYFPESLVSRETGRSLSERQSAFMTKLFSGNDWERKDAVGMMIHWFLASARMTKEEGFNSPLLAWRAHFSEEGQVFLDQVKLLFKKVVNDPKAQLREYRGMSMVRDICKVFAENPMVFLPRKQQGLCSVYPPTRVVCDYVAGMTDEYAARVFREMWG